MNNCNQTSTGIYGASIQVMMQKPLICRVLHAEKKIEFEDERMSNQTVNVSLMFSDHFPFNFAVNPN